MRASRVKDVQPGVGDRRQLTSRNCAGRLSFYSHGNSTEDNKGEEK